MSRGGLGNLVFGAHAERPWTGLGFVVRLTFSRSAPLAVSACPYSIHEYLPRPLPRDDQAGLEARFRGHVERLSVGLGGARLGPRDAEGCWPVLAPKAEPERSARAPAAN
jgi:hypothetical protein